MLLDGGEQGKKWRTHKLESVNVFMRPNELVDISVWHPIRYHRELSLRHQHSHQRQDIRMAKESPQDDLPAEPLHRALLAHTRGTGKGTETHANYLL